MLVDYTGRGVRVVLLARYKKGDQKDSLAIFYKSRLCGSHFIKKSLETCLLPQNLRTLIEKRVLKLAHGFI